MWLLMKRPRGAALDNFNVMLRSIKTQLGHFIMTLFNFDWAPPGERKEGIEPKTIERSFHKK